MTGLMMGMKSKIGGALAAALAMALVGGASADTWLSHPPLREHPGPSDRPMEQVGEAYFVDAAAGDDAHPGSEAEPWRTINHALDQLSPGDTLYLREGTYFEELRVSLVGRPGAPITIRSYPGEVATLDGSMREFVESPADAWEPYTGDDGDDDLPALGWQPRWSGDGEPAADEYVSTRVYPNIRDVVGAFGDSMVGLKTYWHAKDLRSDSEFIHREDEDGDIAPLYAGPGIWYNRETGRIHARLAHTNLPRTVSSHYAVEVDFDPAQSNYRGETDPRELPLVVAAFDSVPLFVSGAEHVRFEDMIIRGGGHDTVKLRHARDITFDNVTVFCGTYGLRAFGVERLEFYRSALHGNVPPWSFRSDKSYRARPGRGLRDTTRLNTHGLLITEGREVSEVYYHPPNREWDVSYSEFTDGFNGVFFTGEDMRFHHNLVDQFTDDAMFLSTPTPNLTDNVHVHSNLIQRALMGVSFHGRHATDGTVYLYRNIFDMRHGVNRSRGSRDDPEGSIMQIRPFKMTRETEHIHIYQNTFALPDGRVHYAGWAMGATTDDKQRRVFNNAFVYFDGYPGTLGVLRGPDEPDAVIDYNLHFSPDNEAPDDFLARVRESGPSEANRERHPDGELWEANSMVADPQFVSFDISPNAANDYRPASGSPLVGAGLVLPEDYEDPLRPAEGGAPSIGALEPDSEPFAVGRAAAP